MWRLLSTWFLYFIIYGLLGRLFENIFVFARLRLIKHSSRKLFQLPFFPAVYGLGGLAVVGVQQVFHLTSYNWLWQFLICGLLCAAVEYFSAVFLEVVYGKNIWWNYAQNKYNLHGRIYLKNCVYFGIGGLLVINFVQPQLAQIVDQLSNPLINGLAIMSLILLIIDFTYASTVNHRRHNFNHFWRRRQKARENKKSKLAQTQRNKVVKV